MTHTTTTSFRPAFDIPTFDHPYHTSSEEPLATNVRQNYYPFFPNYYLVSFPLCDSVHHSSTHIPSTSAEKPGFRSASQEIPSVPSYRNPTLEESTAHNQVPTSSFVIEKLLYDIPSADQLHLHQADETARETLPFSNPSGPPHTPAPLTTLHSQNHPEPTNVMLGSMSTFDQTQAQAAIASPSMAANFNGFGGSTAAPLALEVPLATASPAPGHSTTDTPTTVYTCQCVSGGSPCNAAVRGSIRAVRDHLREDHAFRSVGKDRVVCLWGGCGKSMQRENIPRHIVTRHFRVRVRCTECGVRLSRSDVQYSHARACPARRRTAS